jgi:hypothetical protein
MSLPSVWQFAECFFMGAWQLGSLLSTFQKTLGIHLTHGSGCSLPRATRKTLDKGAQVGNVSRKHSAKTACSAKYGTHGPYHCVERPHDGGAIFAECRLTATQQMILNIFFF